MKLHAFTIIELLVVISLIAVLIAILLPSMGMARRSARMAECMSNLRQFHGSWMSFSNDNAGEMVGAENYKGWTDSTGYRQKTAWVLNNGDTPETDTNLMNGDLWEYVRNTKPYRCPSDHRGYIRSYSINTFINGYAGFSWHHSDFNAARTFTQVPQPDQTLLMLDEPDPRGWTQGSFAFSARGGIPFQWVDWPAPFHFNGFTHAFVDGHSEFYRFQDARTGRITTFLETHPNSADWVYMADIYDPGTPSNP